MKRFLAGILAVLLLISMVGCGENAAEGGAELPAGETSSVEKMTPAELDAAVAQQEVRVTSVEYVVQDEDYKALYPDMLQAVFKNDSTYDLKNVVVAFVAWDENNLPLKIKGQFDFGTTVYVKQCNYNDINLIPGKSYGEDSGLALDSSMKGVKRFKAIVVSYESFDGDTWENPLFDAWKELYDGKRYTE